MKEKEEIAKRIKIQNLILKLLGDLELNNFFFGVILKVFIIFLEPKVSIGAFCIVLWGNECSYWDKSLREFNILRNLWPLLSNFDAFSIFRSVCHLNVSWNYRFCSIYLQNWASITSSFNSVRVCGRNFYVEWPTFSVY